MKRNSIKKSAKPRQNYLVNLITIFDQIHNSMSRLPNFTEGMSLEWDNVVPSISDHFELVERQIIKENEVKLFKETLQLIQQLKDKNSQTRKSDVIIKFSHVADILKNRMKGQLYIKGEARRKIIDDIQNLKDKMIDWGEKEQRRPQQQIEQGGFKYNSKLTDRFTVKYVFNDQTRPSTTNISRVNSASNSRIRLNDIFTNQELVSRQNNWQNNKHKQLHGSKNVKLLQNAKRSLKKSQNIGNTAPSERKMKKRYAVNYFRTEYNKIAQTLLNGESQTQILEKEDDDDDSEGWQEEAKFTEKSQQPSQFHKTVDWNIDDDEPLKSIKVTNKGQTKKSECCISQNFIRSHKNIMFATKGSRPSNLIEPSQKSKDVAQDDEDEPTEEYNKKYKSTKFLPRRCNRNENIWVPRPSRSEKSLPKKNTVIYKGRLKTYVQKTQYFPSSKSHKQNKSNIYSDDCEGEIIKPQQKGSDTKSNTIQPLLYSQYMVQNDSQIKQLRDFYPLLSQMRLQFAQSPNQYFQDRSMFFYQQNILWEQQKRKMKKNDQQRQKQYESHTFEMQTNTTHRNDQKLLKAARNDTFNSPCRFFKDKGMDKLSQVQFSTPKAEIIN